MNKTNLPKILISSILTSMAFGLLMMPISSYANVYGVIGAGNGAGIATYDTSTGATSLSGAVSVFNAQNSFFRSTQIAASGTNVYGVYQAGSSAGIATFDTLTGTTSFSGAIAGFNAQMLSFPATSIAASGTNVYGVYQAGSSAGIATYDTLTGTTSYSGVLPSFSAGTSIAASGANVYGVYSLGHSGAGIATYDTSTGTTSLSSAVSGFNAQNSFYSSTQIAASGTNVYGIYQASLIGAGIATFDTLTGTTSFSGAIAGFNAQMLSFPATSIAASGTNVYGVYQAGSNAGIATYDTLTGITSYSGALPSFSAGTSIAAVAAVPESESYLMLLEGFVLIGFMANRKRRYQDRSK